MQGVYRYPLFAAAHNGLGFALQGKGQLDDAIAEFRKAIELDPSNVLAKGDLEEALRLQWNREQ